MLGLCEIARLRAATVLVVAIAPSLARALPQLQYAVPAACPERAWFEAELASQGLAAAAAGALRVQVSAKTAEVQEWEGQLSYGPHAQTSSEVGAASTVAQPAAWERRISSGDCRDLLSALVMSLVLHLEAEPSNPEPAAAGQSFAAARGPEAIDSGAHAADRAPEWEVPRWRFGGGIGGSLRGGIGPALAGAVDAHVLVRSERSGWGSGPFSMGISWAPATTSATPDARAEWTHSWWAGNVAAAPGTFTFTPGVRVGPVLGFQIGRHSTTGPGERTSANTLAFSELLMRAEVDVQPWLIAAQLGFQLPIAPDSVSYDEGLLHRPGPGLVLGLGASWIGVVL